MAKVSAYGLRDQMDYISMLHNSSIVFDSASKGGTALQFAPVKIVGDMQVALAVADDEVYGTLTRVEADGVCVVQKGGVAEFRIASGATIAAGSAIVAAASSNVVAGTAGAGKGTVLETLEGENLILVDLG